MLFSQDARVNEGFSFSPSQKMSTVILVLAVTLLKSNKCAPANRSKPKWSSKFCTHQFSGAMLVVWNVYVQRINITQAYSLFGIFAAINFQGLLMFQGEYDGGKASMHPTVAPNASGYHGQRLRQVDCRSICCQGTTSTTYLGA